MKAASNLLKSVLHKKRYGVQMVGAGNQHVYVNSSGNLNFSTGSFSVDGWFTHTDFTYPRSTMPIN